MPAAAGRQFARSRSTPASRRVPPGATWPSWRLRDTSPGPAGLAASTYIGSTDASCRGGRRASCPRPGTANPYRRQYKFRIDHLEVSQEPGQKKNQTRRTKDGRVSARDLDQELEK